MNKTWKKVTALALSVYMTGAALMQTMPEYIFADELDGSGSTSNTGSSNTAFHWEDGMHVLVMHFHAIPDPNAVKDSVTDDEEAEGEPGEGGENNEDTTSYTQTISAYIKESDNGFVLVGDDGNPLSGVGSLEFSSGNGQLTVKTNPYEGENFTGFSSAAGASAVTEHFSNKNLFGGLNNSTATITYDEDIHLVKLNLFYQEADDETIRDSQVYGVAHGDAYNKEQDVWDVNGNLWYSSDRGLHTNKTASTADENRRYKVMLESWYADDDYGDVAMVLDSSGSMAWTVDEMDPIKVETTADIEITATVNAGEYQIRRISTGETATYKEGDYLKPEAIDLLLNKKYTDNSKLGYTGYTYYLFDARDGVNEYVPMGYWDGSTGKAYSNAVPQGSKIVTYYSANNGSVSGKQGNALKVGTEPVTLDAELTGQDYTISFVVKTDQAVNNLGNGEEYKFLTISDESDNYYAIARGKGGGGTNSADHLRFFDNNVQKTNAQKLFRNQTGWTGADWYLVTNVIKDGKVTTYINDGNSSIIVVGNNGASLDSLLSGKLTISIGNENADTIGYDMYVDELFVYDCALESSEVASLYKLVNSSNDTYAKAVQENAPIVSSTSKVMVNTLNTNGAGWYYVNSASAWDELKKFDTGKRFEGLGSTATAGWDDPNNATLPAITKGIQAPGYTTNSNPTMDQGPIKMFVKNGILYCVFYQKNQYKVSAVYIKDDNAKIKAGQLRTVLGQFVSKLDTVSPKSIYSATRFSTSKVFDNKYGNTYKAEDEDKNETERLKRFLMQKWTANTEEIIDIMSSIRGTGDNIGFDSNDDGMYNYVLTGDTTTLTGLEVLKQWLEDGSYEAALKLAGRTKSDNPNKHLIIFTDGRDTFWNKYDDYDEKIKNVIADLKTNHHYTVYCVMLKGGINEESQDFKDAKGFLEVLASATQNNEVTQSDGKYVYIAANEHELYNAFTQDIMGNIIHDLTGYSVKDYIDPRFDLVAKNSSGEDVVIHLNNGGNITTVSGAERNVLESDGYNVRLVAGAEPGDTNGGYARLHYDVEKQMYYLQWSNQTIPGNVVGSDKVHVWKSEIKLQAKDDFLGGYDILTNGQAEEMNYVYHDDDDDKSSGIDDMYQENDDKYPSKGFPRTTVNVPVLELEMEDGVRTIYLGEDIEPDKILTQLHDSIDDPYYWEYLERFALLTGQEDTKQLIKTLVTTGELVVPYYYLENKAGTVHAGPENVHQQDHIGWLTYKWQPYPTELKNITAKDLAQKKYQLSVSYRALPETGALDGYDAAAYEDLPIRNNRSEAYENGLVSDDVYQWDKKYKPAAGTGIVDRRSAQGAYTVDIVNGEIVLLLKIDGKDWDYLLKQYPNEMIHYAADLMLDDSESGCRIGTLTIDQMITGQSTYAPKRVTTATEDYVLIPAVLNMTGTELDGFAAQLPIGDYYFVVDPEANSAPAPFQFGSIALNLLDEIRTALTASDGSDAWLQKQYAALGSLQNALPYYESPLADADQDGVSDQIHMGTAGERHPDQEIGYPKTRKEVDDPADADMRGAYLNDRVGLAVVTGKIVFGKLEVKKTVENGSSTQDHTSDEFAFKVTLKDAETGKELPSGFEFEYNGESQKNTMLTIKSGDIFYLRHDETFTILGLPEGTYYEIEEQQKTGYPEQSESGTIYVDSEDPEEPTRVGITNNYSPDGIAVLEVTKELVGRSWNGSDEFTFLLTPADNATKTAIAEEKIEMPENVVPAEDGSGYTFVLTMSEQSVRLSIRFLQEGKYQFTLAELDPEKNDGITYDLTPRTITFNVNDLPEEGKLGGSTDAPFIVVSNGDLTFTNSYTATAAWTPQVKKILENIGWDEVGSFDFRIVQVSSSTGETVLKNGPIVISANKENPAPDFGTITFTKPGTYQFLIEELSDNPIPHITYDSKKYTVTVTVRDEKNDGTLTLQAYYQVNGGEQEALTEDISAFVYEFINIYTAPVGKLRISKEVIDNTVGEDEQSKHLNSAFTFTVILKDADGNELTGSYPYTQDGAEQHLSSGDSVTLKHGESVVIEDLPDGAEYEVIEAESDIWSVSTRAKGTIIENRTAEAHFINTYAPSGNASFTVSKQLTGRAWQRSDVFTFILTPANNAAAAALKAGEIDLPGLTRITDGDAVSYQFTISAEDTADAASSEIYSRAIGITFRNPGVYLFELREAVPAADAQKGIVYDTEPRTLEFNVSDAYDINDGTTTEGELEIGMAVDKSLTFRNHYQTSGAWAPQVRKVLNGRDWQTDDVFTFEIVQDTAEENAALLELKNNTVSIKANTENHTAAFEEIAFTVAGDYHFIIREIERNAENMQFAADQKVTVTVTDNGAGMLIVDSATVPSMFTFVNRYIPSLGHLIVSKKVVDEISGGTQKETAFTFTVRLFDAEGASLTGAYDYYYNEYDGNSEPDGQLVNGSTFTLRDGQSVMIRNLPAGATYQITETVPEGWGATVPNTAVGTITDQQTVTVEFTNTYTPTGTDLLTVAKELTGRAWLETDEFTLILTPDAATAKAIQDGSIVMPGTLTQKNGAYQITLTAQNRSYQLPIRFLAEGSYHFTLREENNKIAGIKYDDPVRTVTFTVHENAEQNGLLVTRSVENGGLTFTNQYSASGIWEPSVQKILKNAEWDENYRFGFRITQISNNSATVKVPTVIWIDQTTANHTQSFGEIEFTKPGVYQFRIEELPGSIEGIKYDNTEYEVTVTVKDLGDGTLEIVVEDEMPDVFVFTNVYDPTTTESTSAATGATSSTTTTTTTTSSAASTTTTTTTTTVTSTSTTTTTTSTSTSATTTSTTASTTITSAATTTTTTRVTTSTTAATSTTKATTTTTTRVTTSTTTVTTTSTAKATTTTTTRVTTSTTTVTTTSTAKATTTTTTTTTRATTSTTTVTTTSTTKATTTTTTTTTRATTSTTTVTTTSTAKATTTTTTTTTRATTSTTTVTTTSTTKATTTTTTTTTRVTTSTTTVTTTSTTKATTTTTTRVTTSTTKATTTSTTTTRATTTTTAATTTSTTRATTTTHATTTTITTTTTASTTTTSTTTVTTSTEKPDPETTTTTTVTSWTETEPETTSTSTTESETTTEATSTSVQTGDMNASGERTTTATTVTQTNPPSQGGTSGTTTGTPSASAPVQTGDTDNMILWLGMLFGAFALITMRKRKGSE